MRAKQMLRTLSNEGLARLNRGGCHGQHTRIRSGAIREVFEGLYTRTNQVDRQQSQGRSVGCEIETMPRLRVNRSRVVYRDDRDQEKGREQDRGLEKCFERFRKHPHVNRVRKILENPGPTPAADESESCLRQCRAVVGEAAGVCWSWG